MFLSQGLRRRSLDFARDDTGGGDPSTSLGMTPEGPFFTEKEPLALSPGAANPDMLGMTPEGEILHFIQDDTEDRSVLSRYRSAVS